MNARVRSGCGALASLRSQFTDMGAAALRSPARSCRASTTATGSTPATSTGTVCSTSSPALTGTRDRALPAVTSFSQPLRRMGRKASPIACIRTFTTSTRTAGPTSWSLGVCTCIRPSGMRTRRGVPGPGPGTSPSSGCAASRRRSATSTATASRSSSATGRIAGAGSHPTGASPAKPWSFHPLTEPGDYNQFYHGTGVGDVNGDGRLDLILNEGWWEQPARELGPDDLDPARLPVRRARRRPDVRRRRRRRR